MLTNIRWNKQKNAMDEVKQPMSIKHYNTHMGGVDLHDQCVNRYRIGIQSKKWWWPCYSWALKSAMVNSWCYYSYMKLCAMERDVCCGKGIDGVFVY